MTAYVTIVISFLILVIGKVANTEKSEKIGYFKKLSLPGVLLIVFASIGLIFGLLEIRNAEVASILKRVRERERHILDSLRYEQSILNDEFQNKSLVKELEHINNLLRETQETKRLLYVETNTLKSKLNKQDYEVKDIKYLIQDDFRAQVRLQFKDSMLYNLVNANNRLEDIHRGERNITINRQALEKDFVYEFINRYLGNIEFHINFTHSDGVQTFKLVTRYNLINTDPYVYNYEYDKPYQSLSATMTYNPELKIFTYNIVGLPLKIAERLPAFNSYIDIAESRVVSYIYSTHLSSRYTLISEEISTATNYKPVLKEDKHLSIPSIRIDSGYKPIFFLNYLNGELPLAIPNTFRYIIE